jgi:hypothetical protein
VGSVEGLARSSVGDGVHDVLAARVVSRPPVMVAQPQWPRAAAGVGPATDPDPTFSGFGRSGCCLGGLCKVFERGFRFGDDGGTVD